MKKVWEGMHLISGYKGKQEDVSGMNTKTSEVANALNDFYARFDCQDFSEARNNVTDRLTSTPAEERGECITVTEDEVLQQLQRTNPNKAAGPEGIKPSILKDSAEQLCSILCVIFNQSLAQCKIPPMCKTSCIVPVPKKSPIRSMNDLWPVALTSAVMKVFDSLRRSFLYTFRL